MKLGHPRGTRSRAAAPLCRKEPVEVVRESGKDVTCSHPEGGVPGTSSWEEATGYTEDQVEGLYPHTGLGTPQDPPIRAS